MSVAIALIVIMAGICAALFIANFIASAADDYASEHDPLDTWRDR